MPDPVLRPVKAVLARVSIDEELGSLVKRLRPISPGVFIILSDTPTGLIGPSMVNDACPVASALKIKYRGIIARKPSDVNDVAFGNAVHKAYINAVREWNPGWVIEDGGVREAVISHDGLSIRIGYSPDILMGKDGEWHLIEVKSSKHQPSHEVQLALYWHLLKDSYNIKAGWLVTFDAVLKYSPVDLAKLARIGLDYMAATAKVLASWTDNGPGITIHGNCPCKWAPICPVWRRYSLERYLGA